MVLQGLINCHLTRGPQPRGDNSHCLKTINFLQSSEQKTSLAGCVMGVIGAWPWPWLQCCSVHWTTLPHHMFSPDIGDQHPPTPSPPLLLSYRYRAENAEPGEIYDKTLLSSSSSSSCRSHTASNYCLKHKHRLAQL